MPKQPSTLVPHLPITLEHPLDKTYAEDLITRVIPDWANKTLRAAASGREVSAWDLHCALDQALSAAATRGATSPQRRIHTREARHLIYKCDAVIEAHLAGLEPVDPGARSPRIAELSREVENLRREIDENHAQAVAEGATLQATIDDLLERLSHLDDVHTRTAKVLEYAVSHLDDLGRAKVEGYTEGLRDA